MLLYQFKSNSPTDMTPFSSRRERFETLSRIEFLEAIKTLRFLSPSLGIGLLTYQEYCDSRDTQHSNLRPKPLKNLEPRLGFSLFTTTKAAWTQTKAIIDENLLSIIKGSTNSTQAFELDCVLGAQEQLALFARVI